MVSTVQRILREIRDAIQSEETTPCGIKVELPIDSLFDLIGEITGPPNTPYEGGKFKLEIKLPSDYPLKPPQVRFLTKMWHPNISSHTGAVCLDILMDKWSPDLSLRTILLSFQVLLSTPEPNDPQDTAVAEQFLENPEMFKLAAICLTNFYAGGPSKNQSFDDKARTFIDLLDSSEHSARASLSSCSWDVEYAINDLVRYRVDLACNIRNKN